MTASRSAAALGAQNTSPAVMAQRREPHTSLDDFPTPPWATRALCEWIIRQRLDDTGLQTVREPAANRGHMVRPLQEYFADVEASDIFDYGAGYPVSDYLFGPPPAAVDWTITNPPFRLAEQFIDRAIRSSISGVAVFVRSTFLEGETRHKRLFSQRPPTDILQFSERVVINKGKLPNPNLFVIDPVTGKRKKPSSATAYCWLVWRFVAPRGCHFDWIAPCRKRLERAADYMGDEVT